jgi:hypothetical protein
MAKKEIASGNVKYCKKCNILCASEGFYKSKNLKSYPDGRIDWCKCCMTQYKKSKKLVDLTVIEKKEPVNFTYTFD